MSFLQRVLLNSQGLRVSIKSITELSNYLLDKVKFKYALTNKMNQDQLEVIIFFFMKNKILKLT